MGNKILIVSGLSGAGKTTLLDKLQKRNSGVDYTVVNIGSMMKEMGMEHKYIKNRDEIKLLSKNRIDKLRRDAYYRVSGMSGNIVLDTHTTIENNKMSSIMPGLPYHSLIHLKKISGLIYINAPTEDILKRRLSDKKRSREIQDSGAIKAQRIVDISMLSYYSTYLNISLYIIDNIDGKKNLAVALSKLEGAFKEVFGD